jgi:hypothetical protein
MTPRQIRRAAEREARKAENKQHRAPVGAATPSPAEPATPAPASPAAPIERTPAAAQEPTTRSHAGSIISEAQLAANRANAQLSTGPTTAAGKEKSSQNRVTHGLAGTFRLLGWEDPEQFKELATSLYDEHKPATDSERRLVDSMTQHFWLMQRAITLQDRLLSQPELDHKTFSLYLRYQTTNERAYYRAKREFATARKEQSKQQNGFESQKRQQEAHQARIRLTNARAANAEIENYARSTMEVPLPGNIRVPFEDLTAAFRLTLQNLNKEMATELTKNTAA